MYLDHRTVDGKCNIILDCFVTKGNVHDSQPYIKRIKWIQNTFDLEVRTVALDSGYDTLDIKKFLKEENIFGVIGYRRYGTKESRKFKHQFAYDYEGDYFYHKDTGEALEFKGLIDRNGYKKYANLDNELVLRRHIKEELNEEYTNNRLSDEGKQLYTKRKETVERSFADSKQNHGYRYATLRGLKKNQDHTWLLCAAQNMKNIALKVTKVLEYA